MIETHKYVTYKEISEIINQLEDYRDKVLVMLIFDGFYTNMDEIQNLTEEDLEDKSRNRYLGGRKISGVTLRVIHKALKETQVHTFSSFKGGLDELIPSNYILRERLGYLNRCDIKVGENFNGFAMNKQAIINRFSRMKRHYGLKFSLSTLYGSGVIHRGLKNIPLETPKHRVKFLNYLEEEEGVNRGMGYFYYKEFLKMLPRLEKENQEKESE